MTVEQATVSPLVKNDALELVTLKNLVSLDLAEQTENALQLFNLIEGPTPQINAIPNTVLSTAQLHQLIAAKNDEVAQLRAQLKNYKHELAASSDPNIKLLAQLSSEFTSATPITQTEPVETTVQELATQEHAQILFKPAGNYYNFVKRAD